MNIKDYLARPYHIVIQYIPDESGPYYIATVQEFYGCMCRGATYTEAYEKIQAAMGEWIKVKLADGDLVPEPIDERQFSGRFVLRVPKTLHASLAMEAEREGVSLNQYVIYRLSALTNNRDLNNNA